MTPSTRRGMNIIEAMIALGVMSLLIMAILSLLPTARIAVKRAQIRICADAEAQSRLEELRSQAFDTLATGDLGTITHEGLPEFKRDLEVIPAGPQSKELRVTVRWEWSGHPMSVKHCLIVSSLPR